MPSMSTAWRTISISHGDEEFSHILRNRVVHAAHAGNHAVLENALHASGDDGERQAQPSHAEPIQRSRWNSDDDQKYEEAIAQTEKLYGVEAKLRGINVPTMEPSFVSGPGGSL